MSRLPADSWILQFLTAQRQNLTLTLFYFMILMLVEATWASAVTSHVFVKFWQGRESQFEEALAVLSAGGLLLVYTWARVWWWLSSKKAPGSCGPVGVLESAPALVFPVRDISNWRGLCRLFCLTNVKL